METKLGFKETYDGKKIDTANIMNIDEAAKLLDGRKVVFISGVTGQAGSLMVDYLLESTDFQIFGGVRRLSVYNHSNLKLTKENGGGRFFLINFDLTDSHSISRVVQMLKPDFLINMGAQSFVASSWDFSRMTFDTNCGATVDILEAIRLYRPSCKCYFSGSSEEMGGILYSPQDENHPLSPLSPYAASKAAARQFVKVYRESYGLYAVQCWCWNFESERRGEEFVTRKITLAVARIINAINKKQNFEPLELGNVDAKRDWSYARDTIDAIWRCLNQDVYNVDYKGTPVEYAISSGSAHTVRDFVKLAFGYVGLHGDWVGEGEKAAFLSDSRVLAKVNPKFFRPAEVNSLLGDSSRIRKELNWQPKVGFEEMVEIMVKNDLKAYNEKST